MTKERERDNLHRDYYLLIDCNNFFVSCERVFRPDLNGKPVVVLSSNDGCVIARSNEVKALGVEMGVPLFKIRDIIKRHNVAVFSSNHTLYTDFSHRVFSLLRQVAPQIEIYSIDEAFVDMRGVRGDIDIEDFARKTIKLIKKGCGIPVSIGIAPTKTLAKLASRCVKKGIMGSDGVCVLSEAKDIEDILSKTQIGDIWGIGRKSVISLRRDEIETALDYVKRSPSWIKKSMTIRGYRTWQELNSIQAIEFGEREEPQQSIMVSRSFTREISDFDELSAALANFITSAVDKLRRQGSAAKQITIIAETNRFTTTSQNYSQSRVHHFDVASNTLTEMMEVGVKLLKSIFVEGVGYKKTGVILSGLIPSKEITTNLFDSVDRERQSQLMEAIDLINSRHGRGTIISARRGFDSLPISGQNVSPNYTTAWSDILVVK